MLACCVGVQDCKGWAAAAASVCQECQLSIVTAGSVKMHFANLYVAALTCHLRCTPLPQLHSRHSAAAAARSTKAASTATAAVLLEV